MRPWRSRLNSPLDNSGSSSGSGGAIASQSDVTGSRAIDGTVYHNSTTKPIMVVVSVGLATADTVEAKSDATATPTLRVGYLTMNGATNVIMELVFWVLPGSYYKVTRVGSGNLNTWMEYT